MATPWGVVYLAATTRGIVAVELMTTREAFAEGIERRLGLAAQWVVRVEEPVESRVAARGPDADAVRHLEAAAAAIEAQASGGDGDEVLSRLPIDLEDRPAWDRAVLDAVRAIPRGEVRSYGDIARAIGRPGAARAVGGAVGRNPLGLLVPCHRVIAGDGTLGGYGGGWWGDHERLLDLKAELLAHEGIVLPRSRPPGRSGR